MFLGAVTLKCALLDCYEVKYVYVEDVVNDTMLSASPEGHIPGSFLASPDVCRLIAWVQMDPWLQYDFPTPVRNAMTGSIKNFKGQTQKCEPKSLCAYFPC